MNKIITRLEIIKNYILLEDIDALKKETEKLKEYDLNDLLVEIIEDIEKKEFGTVIIKIQNFISINRQITGWNDPEIIALKLELKSLEDQQEQCDHIVSSV